MSYIVGFGERYPRRPHHRGASIPKNKVKCNCKGGWKWRDTSKPNPNTLAGAMVPKMGSSLSITMCRGGATPAFKMGSPTSRRRLRIRSVLERLEDPSTRAEAWVFLSDLQGRLDSQQSPEQCFDRFHFRIERIFLDQYEDVKRKTNELRLYGSATHDGNRTDQLDNFCRLSGKEEADNDDNS